MAERPVKKIPPRITIVVLAVLGWFLSGAIHELGHVLVAKMAGLKVIHIQPWALMGRVHVRFAGETTGFWHAAINISGMLFTVLVGITGTIVTFVAARRRPAMKIGMWLFIPMMCQSFAWIVLPLAVAFGASAPSDDVTSFMHNSGWGALAVSATGLCLAALCGGALMWTYKQGAANKRPHDNP